MPERLSIRIFLLSVLLSGAVHADTAWLEFALVESGAIADHGRFSLAVGDGVVAVTLSGATKDASTLYRRDGDEVVFIDHDRGEFTVMSESWLKTAAERARDAAHATRARLQALADKGHTTSVNIDALLGLLPLAPRERSDRPDVEYRFRDRIASYNGLTCREFDEQIDGRQARIVCLAAAEGIGFDAAQHDLVERFIATLARLEAAGLGDFGFEVPTLAMAGAAFEGIPIVASDAAGNGYLAVGPATSPAPAEALRVPERYLEAKIPFYGF